ncbi:plasmid partitioning protein RepB (plasmid) [Rhizobium sp. TH2]|uniref:plasmid partitioning protein RepB n=1 Tax=Rhizobium sp. TH2 TaxID=2775403 RepID=UPI0021582DE3|nr:plasmid partitioning protein RepB [Rhizobium sp. TH2]UVC12241.1 plasmid partitioning protein RepB [Rhizobium sp. TH2]
MARKDIFANITHGQGRRTEESYIAHGAAKAMISSIEDFAVQVREGGVRELDPNLIDPSPFPDRLPDDDPQPFEDFKKSIAEDGQKVPVQVRPHPVAEGRYQTVYGHRRVRAAKDLDKLVKAIVIEISDADLAVAQGVENAARQDLSWIERALFAKRMEEAGVKSREIQAALAVGRQELARLRGVWSALPIDLIEAIGRAPKIGRPRWQELAKLVELHPERVDGARKMVPAGNISSSDQRFQFVFNVMKAQVKPAVKAGQLDLKISASSQRGRAFAKFVESRLPALIEEFEQGEN